MLTTTRKPKKAAVSRSESTEDHLERIQELIEQKGYARVADLASTLRLSTGAVSNMVRRLAERGFVNYERYRGFTLTPTGRQVAQHVKARHKILTEFLELVGLDAQTVNKRGGGHRAPLAARDVADIFATGELLASATRPIGSI